MVTIFDLKEGSRPRITEREFAQLRGCSTATLQKERWKGTGPTYLKDPISGRVFYSAEVVIDFLDRSVACRSTSQYSNVVKQANLSMARAVMQEQRTTLAQDAINEEVA